MAKAGARKPAKAARPTKKPARKPTPAKRPAKSAPAKPAPAKAKKPASPSAKPARASAKSPAKPNGVGSPTTRVKDADLSVAGQVYQRGKLVPAVLHIDTASGKVVRVARSTALEQHLDFGKLAILPGAIDVHVHFREPGATQKEDLTTGSTSAAFGGVTTFVDMPNTSPATITLGRLKEKLQLMAQKSVVDYGAWAGGTWYTGELDAMLQHAVGVKTYLGSSTGDLLLEDQERFRQVLEAAGKSGRPVALHAEAERVLAKHRRTENTIHDHDHTRPPEAEQQAIYDAMTAQQAVKRPPRIHIAHAASPDAVHAAVAGKFSVGICPHHLLLDTNVGLGHAYGKMNPPLRSPQVREELWKLFAAGKIPILESDHAPHTKADKESTFHAAPSGVPGVETMVPLMLAMVKAGKVELQTVVDAACKNPAELLGQGATRGILDAGSRADFAVYDLKHAAKVDSHELHSKCGWSPFDGMNAIFPSDVFLAGKPVVREQQFVGAAGRGQPIVSSKK